MTCDDCKYFLPYQHDFNCSIFGKRTFDGICRCEPHTEHKNGTMWCGKFKSKGKTAPKTKRFVRPTLQQVEEYIKSRKSDVDAAKWMDHYESKGWQIGKGAMKDWKAAVRTWEKKRQPGINDCVDCGAPYEQGFRFTTVAGQKQRVYRCPVCQEAHNESKTT